MENHSASFDKAHPAIKLYGAMICGSDVEPGNEAVAAMVSDEVPDEAFRVPFATMIRMGADSADLWVPVKRQALATHGDQFTLGPYPEVRAHLAGSAAKEAWEGDVCEGDHLVRVVSGQRNDFDCLRGRRNLRG
jgi:hypothetical protein